MSFNATLWVGTTAALAMFSFSPMTAVAGRDDAARLHRHPAHHAIYRPLTVYRGPIYQGEPLPAAPEYGFLHHVPPNAVRAPGYTFVPGKGILGAACDLPTSACTNEYRDVQ